MQMVKRAFFLFILVEALSLGAYAQDTTNFAGQAKNGEIDLSTWRIDKQDRVTLDGEWRFFSNAFLSPGEALEKSNDQESLVTIPHLWREEEEGSAQKDHGSSGFGTYLLRIKGLHDAKKILGFTMRADTAFKAYLFKSDQPDRALPLASLGVPGTSEATSIPQVGEPLKAFWLGETGVYYLLIHVSNFHWSMGGIWGAPVIGDFEAMERSRNFKWLSDLFVIGMLFIMGVYNLSLYFNRKEDTSSLWLAGFIIVTWLRFLGTGCILYNLFPEPEKWVYELARKFELSCINLSTAFMAYFLYSSFLHDRLPRVVKYYIVYSVIFFLLHVFTDAAFFSKFIILNQVPIMIFATLILIFVCKEAIKGTLGARISVLGFLAIFITSGYDIALGMGLISSDIYLGPYGLAILIFCQSQVIAVMFAKAFRTAENLSKDLQREVERQTRDIRSMLDHIPEGIFTIVPPGVIQPNFSAYMNKIFNKDEIAGKNAVDFLLGESSLNKDQVSRIQSAITSALGEPIFTFECNSSHLVRQVDIISDPAEPKNLEVSWNPIASQDDNIEKILVTLKDVTELKKLEKANLDQRKELEYIAEIVNVSREKFDQFIDMSYKFIEENQRLINQNRDRSPEVLKILFINMHTIKGSARSYGFNKMTGILHEIEQNYANILKNSNSVWDQRSLSEDLQRSRNIIEIYDYISTKKLGREKGQSSKISLERSFLEDRLKTLRKIDFSRLNGDDFFLIHDYIRSFDEVCYDLAVEVFYDILGMTERLARDLGKEKPVINVDDPGFRINYDAQQLFRNIFVHIVRNSLDHGIEPPKERIEKGKTPTGHIDVKLYLHEDKMVITYRDDGRGLNLKALHNNGIKKSWLDPQKHYQPQDIAELIFQSGLSTSSTISEISGRGIGMDAVRRYLVEAGGNIKVVLGKPSAEEGFYQFHFELSLPEKFFTFQDKSLDRVV